MPLKNFAANDRRLSLISEVYHKLRMGILMSRADESPTTLLFTSSTPGEGKTTTAINTAIMFARMGSCVLVVDADLRQPSCLKALRVESERGLADYLANLAPLDQLIQPTSLPISRCWGRSRAAQPDGTVRLKKDVRDPRVPETTL